MLATLVAALALPRGQVHAGAQPASLRMTPEIGALLGAGFCNAVAHGALYAFLSLHLTREGYSGTTIGMLWTLGVAAEIVVFLYLPHLFRRYALSTLLVASLGCGVLRFAAIGWAAGELWIVLMAQLLHAATFGSFHAAAVAAVHRVFPEAGASPRPGAVFQRELWRRRGSRPASRGLGVGARRRPASLFGIRRRGPGRRLYCWQVETSRAVSCQQKQPLNVGEIIMRTTIIAVSVSLAFLSGCQSVDTTQAGVVGVDRDQRMMVSSQEVDAGAKKAYAQMMAEAQKKGVLDKDAAMLKRVQDITKRLIPHTAVFRPGRGQVGVGSARHFG